mmetsp:Transcript_32490/g.100545  ORF Transcript_32490/g.100545 Transcript_32490/m.100545 type:complete len:245 (+) Transcript_32490:1182-1916(+)
MQRGDAELVGRRVRVRAFDEQQPDHLRVARERGLEQQRDARRGREVGVDAAVERGRDAVETTFGGPVVGRTPAQRVELAVIAVPRRRDDAPPRPPVRQPRRARVALARVPREDPAFQTRPEPREVRLALRVELRDAFGEERLEDARDPLAVAAHMRPARVARRAAAAGKLAVEDAPLALRLVDEVLAALHDGHGRRRVHQQLDARPRQLRDEHLEAAPAAVRVRPPVAAHAQIRMERRRHDREE